MAMTFEVDADEIIAKLHLAAVAACKTSFINKTDFVSNTIVLEDDKNATPEKPDIEMTKMDQAEYQVGYVTDIEYQQAFGGGIKQQLQDYKNAMKAWRDKGIDAIKDDKDQVVPGMTKEQVLALGNKLAQSVELDTLVNDATNGDLDKAIEDAMKKADDAEKKEQDVEKAEQQKILDKAKSDAAKILLAYMQTFVGKDNLKTFNESSIGVMYVDPNITDPSSALLIDDKRQFKPIDDAQKSKMQEQFKKNYEDDPSKPNCKVKICFNVKYNFTNGSK